MKNSQLLSKAIGVFLAVNFVLSVGAYAAPINIHVKDSSGNNVEFAVVSIVGGPNVSMPVNLEMPAPIMVQENVQFNPFVLPIAKGTTVSFPNKDFIRHHVYSFSKVKRFELDKSK